MNDILHANIFFFITSVVTIVLGLGAAVALWYIIAILREVRAIVVRIRKASEDIEQDFQSLRQSVKAGGERVRSLGGVFFDFLLRMLERSGSRTPRRRQKNNIENSDLV